MDATRVSMCIDSEVVPSKQTKLLSVTLVLSSAYTVFDLPDSSGAELHLEEEWELNSESRKEKQTQVLIPSH